MDPLGIPHLSGADEDVNSPMATEKLLLDRTKTNLKPHLASLPTAQVVQ